jgi:hypothetical protein
VPPANSTSLPAPAFSQVLDDMEQTGVIPYLNRGSYYNVYSRLYKLLSSKAKQLP